MKDMAIKSRARLVGIGSGSARTAPASISSELCGGPPHSTPYHSQVTSADSNVIRAAEKRARAALDRAAGQRSEVVKEEVVRALSARPHACRSRCAARRWYRRRSGFASRVGGNGS